MFAIPSAPRIRQASSVMTLPNGDYEGLTICIDLDKLTDNTPDILADIAAQVGYDSQSKFSSSFKEQYHLLPSEYRKKP